MWCTNNKTNVISHISWKWVQMYNHLFNQAKHAMHFQIKVSIFKITFSNLKSNSICKSPKSLGTLGIVELDISSLVQLICWSSVNFNTLLWSRYEVSGVRAYRVTKRSTKYGYNTSSSLAEEVMFIKEVLKCLIQDDVL